MIKLKVFSFLVVYYSFRKTMPTNYFSKVKIAQ